VDGDRGHPVEHPQLDARQKMPVEGMDPTRTQQPDEVQGPSALPEAGTQLYQRRKLIEFTCLDALGDPNQILGDHPAGTDVQVPHLAVPHLAPGKANGETTGVEQGTRKASPESVPDRGGSQLDGISFALAPVSPAVQNHQDNPVPGTSV
jgi:hypothetical protein